MKLVTHLLVCACLCRFAPEVGLSFVLHRFRLFSSSSISSSCIAVVIVFAACSFPRKKFNRDSPLARSLCLFITSRWCQHRKNTTIRYHYAREREIEGEREGALGQINNK